MNFIEQAYKGKNDWWRYLITLFLVFIGWQLLGVIPLVLVAGYYAGDMQTFMQAASDSFMSLGIDNNLYLALMIFTFFGGLMALFFGVKFIHNRAVKTLITAREKVDWKRVLFAFGLWVLIAVAMEALSFVIYPDDYVWNFKPVPFLILFLISLFLLPLQTSFEELLFRGYFMQGLGIAFKNAIVPLVVTSVVFGLLHGFNPEVEKLGNWIMVYYIGTGFLFGITTLMDDGTELALGLHAANNFTAAVLVSSDWMVFQTDALWINVSEPSIGPEIYILVFVVYPVVLWIFSRKYAWKNWKEKLLTNRMG